jgi:hypothetical protein
VKLWLARTKQENSENYQVIRLQDVSQSYSYPTPTKEKPRSILNEELKCKIAKTSSRWLKWIYHLPYLQFRIRRYQSHSEFGKTGITSSFGLRLTQVIVFRKGNDDAHAPTKHGPRLLPRGTNRPMRRLTGLLLCPFRSIFWKLRPLPPTINLNHLLMLVWSYSSRYPHRTI